MNISKLSKADVLADLYNNSKQLILEATPHHMTSEEAQDILDSADGLDFSYLKGRIMKIDLSKDELNTAAYNKDNGAGAAEAALSKLKPKKSDVL